MPLLSSLYTNGGERHNGDILTVSVLVRTMMVAGSVGMMVYHFGFRKRQLKRQQEQQTHQRPQQRAKMGRSWSVSSLCMVEGAFPKHADAPEHIINAVLLFDRDDLPADTELADTVVRPLLQYHRLSSVSDGTAPGHTRPCRNNNHGIVFPSSMIRRITFDDGDVYVHAMKHLQDSLQSLRALHPNNDINDKSSSSSNDTVQVELPWWELLVLENTTANTSGPSAVVFRVHHALADGISIVRAFFDAGIIQDSAGKPLPLPDVVKRFFWTTQNRSSSSPSLSSNGNSQGIEQQQQQQQQGKQEVSSLPPKRPSVWTMVKEGIKFLTLGMTKFDDDTAFNRSIHLRRLVYSHNRSHVIFPSVPMAFIKAIKNAAQVTVNDVVMAAVSQAIYDYCVAQQCPVVVNHKTSNVPVQCRALLPASLPRPEAQSPQEAREQGLCNRWCFVSTDLAVTSPTPQVRLQRIHEATTDMKDTWRPAVNMAVQRVVGPVLPPVLLRQTAYDIFVRHSLVFSNVPGPDFTAYLAGHKLVGIQNFYGNILPQIGFLSYNGTLFGNFVADPNDIVDLQSMALYYGQALLTMAHEYGLDRDTIPESLTEFCKTFPK